MTKDLQPILPSVAIAALRPTQITVGRREVEVKRKAWRDLSARKKREFLGRHPIPVILGPKNHCYVIDHHHLALALHEEGVKDVLLTVIADLSKLEQSLFWATMDSRSWVYPFDGKGKRRDYKVIPKTLSDLLDDPFRSLAGELRRVGGYSKETIPFDEFQWADFLRRRIKRNLVEKEFARALEKALALAKSNDADYLPGWCGPSSTD